jgi:hypothetical protein
MKLRLSMRVVRLLGLALTWCVVSLAQDSPAKKPAADSNAIDPLALKVLKAVIDPVAAAKNFEFHALVAEEHLGTNNQVITKFRVEHITMARPDKLKVEVKRAENNLEFYLGDGKATLYSPQSKLFTTVAAPTSVDAALKKLSERDISFVFSNLLESNPYQSLTTGLKSGYVIGQTTILEETVHHLAFTDANSDWQLWVTGGENPRLLRAEIVDRSTPDRLRTNVTFLDWNFTPTIEPGMFAFQKPNDAKQIQLAQEGKAQSKTEAKQ